MKKLLLGLVAALSVSVYSADGIDNSFNKWVLDQSANTLSYKGWVFNTAGSMDALKITSVSSYVAEGKTDIDFSTIYEDTGATVVELGGSLLASYPGKQGNFVGTVVLAPSIETIGINLCVYGGVTNFVFPPNSRLTKIPNQLLGSTGANVDLSTIPRNITAIGDAAFNSKNAFGELIVPATCKSIGDSAFNGAGKISIKFEEGSQLETVGAYAFNTSKIEGEVHFPASLKSIGNRCFTYCSGLTNVTLHKDSTITSLPEYVFYATSIKKFPEIPKTVETIGDFAFFSCSQMAGSVIIPSNVKSLGNNVFECCKSLNDIYFENGCTNIGNNVFSSCHSVTNIVFPKTLKYIGGGVMVGGAGSNSAQWDAMVAGNIWWQSCPEFGTTDKLFLYCDRYPDRSMTITNHLSSVQWEKFAVANPETFVLPSKGNPVGVWTSSTPEAIVNWGVFPLVIIIN